MSRRNILVLAILVVLVGVAVYQNVVGAQKQPVAAEEEAPKTNYAAPSFELTALDGKTYRVGGERDKPLVVNFWATWCPPCQQEAPDLQKLFEQFQGQIDFYTVNLTQSDKLDNVQQFVRTNKLTFPVLLDKDGAAADKYKFVFIPTSYLIDRKGTVREVVNVLPREQWEQKLKSLLKK